MPNGGKLTLRATNASFLDHANVRTSRGAPGGHYVLFEVSDTGNRNSPSQSGRRSSSRSLPPKAQGKAPAWAWLPCDRIVESHAGLLSLQTKTGKGTTFHILIPASRAAQPARPSATEAERRRSLMLRLL